MYGYDAVGRVNRRTWARGAFASYGYNGYGDLTLRDYSDATPDVEFLGFDALGRPHEVHETRAAGVVDVTGLAYTDVTGDVSVNYAAGHSVLPSVSVLASEDAATGRAEGYSLRLGATVQQQVSYSYNGIGQLEHVQSAVLGAAALDTQYEYHAGTESPHYVTTREGATVVKREVRDVDLLGRLRGVHSSGAAGVVAAVSYEVDALGRRTSARREDGSAWSYGYDAKSQVTAAEKELVNGQKAAGMQFSYLYDEIGNRKWWKSDGRMRAYVTNSVNQYTGIENARSVDLLVSYGGTKDEVPNVFAAVGYGLRKDVQLHYLRAEISTMASGMTFPSYTVQKSNKIENGVLYIPAQNVSPSYDDDGNLIYDGRWVYGYDAENRLISIETSPAALTSGAANVKLEFLYDFMSRRIGKRVITKNAAGNVTSDVTNVYAYQRWNLVGEYEKSSSLTLKQIHTWGLDISNTFQGAGGVAGLLHSSTTGNADILSASNAIVCLSSYDGNGNIIAWHKKNGELILKQDYDAFGNITTREKLITDNSITDNLHFSFSTKFQDQETKLYYYGYRFYDANQGRWLNRDPIGEDGGLNLYGMVGNNIIKHWDGLGLTACDDYVNKLADHLDEPGGRNKLSDDLADGKYPNGKSVDGFKNSYIKGGQDEQVYRHLDRGIASGLYSGFQINAQLLRDKYERWTEDSVRRKEEKTAEVNADRAAKKAADLLEDAFEKLNPIRGHKCKSRKEKEDIIKELKEKLKDLLCN